MQSHIHWNEEKVFTKTHCRCRIYGYIVHFNWKNLLVCLQLLFVMLGRRENTVRHFALFTPTTVMMSQGFAMCHRAISALEIFIFHHFVVIWAFCSFTRVLPVKHATILLKSADLPVTCNVQEKQHFQRFLLKMPVKWPRKLRTYLPIFNFSLVT